MRRDPRATYAQSSDIKSRTHLEYRRDMKRKAIAELEVIEWLQILLQQRYPDQNVRVFKSGGDRFLWFLRSGRVTREPDFTAQINGEKLQIEFQYAEKSDLEFYDFKISKVATRQRNDRILVPKKNIIILYIHKPMQSYALIEPAWIVNNGNIAEVPAWRSVGFRVPADIFHSVLVKDDNLLRIIKIIECKNIILNFQYELIERTRQQLADRIEQAVENKHQFSIIPDDLESLFHACFIMDALGQRPTSVDRWLEEVLRFARNIDSLEQAFQLAYCFDFLYLNTPTDTPPHSLGDLAQIILKLLEKVRGWYSPNRGAYRSSNNAEPCLETRYALFVINSTEDIIQDMLYYHSNELDKLHIPLEPIKIIYQSVKDPCKTSDFIKQCNQSTEETTNT